MFLSERWKKKIQDHEHKVQLIKLRNEVMRLEHNLLELCKEQEEDKRVAHEQSLKFQNCFSHEHEICKDVKLESHLIFDSYGDDEECFDLFPYEQGSESAGGLFNESSNIHHHDLCELIGEPIFDSYEQKYVHNEAELPNYDEYLHDLGELNSLGLPPSECFADHETMIAPNGLNQTHTQLEFAKHDPPMFWESFFAPNCHSSFVKGSIQSRSNSFKNCYAFTRKGLHSVLTPMEEATFKPGVQSGRANGDSAEPSNSVQSWFPLEDSAQDVPSTSGHFPTIFRGLNTHGLGLLDYYIEDDELKDVRGCYFSLLKFQLQDLWSNLQQPGVFDAGASWPC